MRAFFTPLRIIPTQDGDVRHAVRDSDPGFAGFGEAYFSTINEGAVKGWKRHRKMTLNLIVPSGEVRFVVHDENTGRQLAVHLTPDRPEAYGRLTVDPGLWVAFGGVSAGLNFVLNVGSIAHDPTEVDARSLERMPWTWTGDLE